MAFDSITETELAFTIPKYHSFQIQRHPLITETESKQQQLVSVYFDTPTRTLENSGWTVRLRSNGDQRIQTVKGPPISIQRPEYEIELDPSTNLLDVEKLQVTPIWPIIGHNAPALMPVFETNINRVVRNLRFENTHIELALDTGSIRSHYDGRTQQINDLELELKDGGDIGAMFRLAIQLVYETGIVMQTASKAERGYQLVNNRMPDAHKHQDITLTSDIPTILGFRQLLGEALTHLRRNLGAVRADNPDGVHQVRIALRRLRALLVMFRPILHHETVVSFENELRHFNRVMGDARDWDVFLIDTLPTAAKAMPSSGWLNLVRWVASEKQTETRSQVHKEIDGARFNSLILSLMGWAEDYPVTAAPRRIYQRPINEVMPDLLSSISAKMNQRQTRVSKKAETMHDLRKSMKKMRYATEFAESLFPARKVKRFLRPCKAVQEALGGFNDVAVTRSLLATLTGSYPAVTPAIRELAFWLDERERNATLAVPKLLRKMRQDEEFWH